MSLYLCAVCGPIVHADVIRLHEQAGVPAEAVRVTLAHVAELDGAAAEALGQTVVAELSAAQSRATVTLEAIRRALDQRGVNWAEVSLAGYATCRVTRLTPPAEPQVDPAAAVASNPRDEVTLRSTMTLRDLLIQRLEQVAGASAADLRVVFHERDAETLERAVFGHRYEVVPHKERGLGRLLLKVRRYEMERVAEQFTITATVQRRALAAVATRTINRGEPFLNGAFEVRQVHLDDASVSPIAEPKLLLGQIAGRLLREGAIITPDDVRSAVMVRRGELVTVRVISGNLVVRIDARAMEDGATGETIRLRNERSRESFTAMVTGQRRAALNLQETPSVALRQTEAP